MVLAEVRAEREAQLQHFDSLDSKAGIVLGFAGALVALSPPGAGVLINLGRGIGVLAALLALSAFWPRTYKTIANLRLLRDRYLTAEEVFTVQRILDTQIAMADGTFETLRSKAFRLKLAMIALAAAAATVATGLGVT
ncbi:MAG: hypothetical protein ACRDH9_02900 [Actinomycetota bacterium]